MTTGRTASNSGLYIQFQTAVLLQLPRPEELDDETLKRWINGQELLKKTLGGALLPSPVETPATDKFTLVRDLGVIEVPEGYVHGKRLDSFVKDHRQQLYYCNDAITDKNFSPKATTQLTPGRRIRVKVYGHAPGVGSTTSVERMDFLRAMPDNLFLGAHGVTLVWDKREELPKGKWYCSFDEKDALWRDSGGRHGVPFLRCDSDGGFGFGLGGFGGGWGDGDCLLGFSDVSSDAQIL